ncbi:MAG: metallophosphoesterase [Cytophagaceae bacterium]
MDLKILAVSAIIVLAFFTIIYLLTRRKKRIAHYSSKVSNWQSFLPGKENVLHYSVFLIGDAGAPSLNNDPNLNLLRAELIKAGEDSAVFFLGDNIYPVGMPEKSDAGRDLAEKRMIAQMKILEGYKGKKVFISGNHDWNKGRKGGYEAVMRQQEFVENYFQSQDVYLPRNGCPGPVELNINEKLSIIIINTQWWVHNGHRPLGRKEGCSVDNEHEFFIVLEELLERNKDKRIVVIAHHPLYSKALHGGHFSVRQHVFPLTEVNKKMYIPMPVAGSLYPIYRKYFGAKEDMSHPRYKRLRKRLLDIFCKYDDLIYAAGHDHNLQYIHKNKQHYIVSGAGSKVNYVDKGDAVFSHAHKGFFKLDFYNEEVWMEVHEPDYDNFCQGKVVFRKKIV